MDIKKIIKSNIFKDSFWMLLGSALGKGLGVIGGIFIANILGKDLYGEYGLLRNTLLLIAIFSTMGLGYTSTVFVARYYNHNLSILKLLIKKLIRITFYFSFIVAIITFIFSSKLAVYLEDPNLESGLKYLSLIIIFNALTTTQVGVLSGFKVFKDIAIVNILSGTINFTLSVGLTYKFGFNGAVIALLLSQILNFLLNKIALHKQFKNIPDSYNETIHLEEILKSSLPIALQEMSVSVMHWSTSILLLKLTNYGEVGLYSASTQWSTIILFIPVVLRNVTLSHLSSAKNNLKKRNRIIYSMLILYVICTFTPSTFVYIFSENIVSVYDVSFNGLKYVLVLACYSTVFNSIYNVFSSEFIASGRNWLMYVITFCRDILILLLLYILINICKLSGAFSLALSNLSVGLIVSLVCWLSYLYFSSQYNYGKNGQK